MHLSHISQRIIFFISFVLSYFSISIDQSTIVYYVKNSWIIMRLYFYSRDAHSPENTIQNLAPDVRILIILTRTCDVVIVNIIVELTERCNLLD